MNRPRVLFVGDQPDWAFEHVALQVRKSFGDRYNIEIIPYNKLPKQPVVDTVCWMWWKAAIHLKHIVRHARRTCVALYDSYTIARDPILFMRVASLTDCFFTGNEAITNNLRKVVPSDKIVMTEDGVDFDLFQPQPYPDKFTVGWTGNNMYEKNGLGDLKGVKLIREACRRIGVPLVIQDRQRKHMPHILMAEGFYAHISCYVCASQCEGTPNPVLESLACGRPVVSTDVGTVSKVARGSTNSVIIVNRTVEDICRGILKVKQNFYAAHTETSKIIAPWNWREKVKAFGPVLGDKP